MSQHVSPDNSKSNESSKSHLHDDACHQKHRRRQAVATVTLLFLLGCVTSISVLYYSSAQTIANKDSEIISLLEEVETLQSQARSKNAELETAENAAASKRTAYSAEVGKFLLDLDPSYAVIEKLDGNGEGGRATSIAIALVDDSRENVIQASGFGTGEKLEILARPFENEGNAEAIIQALVDSGGGIVSGVTVDVAGVSATEVTIGSLCDEKRYYFDYNDITYQIISDKCGADPRNIFTDIVGAFTFSS